MPSYNCSGCGSGSNSPVSRMYSSSPDIGTVVNKFYVNIGNVNINNGNLNYGIQHSIAAERTGDINIYSQSIDNRVTNNNTYTLNLDNRKIEFVSPYIGNTPSETKYLGSKDIYLLPAPAVNDYQIASPEYHNTITTGILKSRRPVTQFVGRAKEVQHLVTETFEKLTGQTFPDDIVIRVCGEEEMKKAHSSFGGKWSPGIMGFAINRHPSPSSIFIRKNHLDELMLTIGHELGHVVAPKLGNAVDEEAKAFAFELAWAKAIVENDIGGLSENFDVDFMPAQNGLHDRAFAFVQNIVHRGKDALKVFLDLAQGVIDTSTKSL